MTTLAPGGGYGDAGTQYLAGLDEIGVPVTWTIWAPELSRRWRRKVTRKLTQPTAAARIAKRLSRRMRYDTFLLHIPPPSHHDELREAERRARAFCYAAWELCELPEDWPPALNGFEGVFVPSEFNRRALVDGGVTAPVTVVPHVAREVRPLPQRPGERFWGDVDEDDFVFYTVGTWSTRKALDQTLRAFLETFRADEKVALVVKTGPDDWIALAREKEKEGESGGPEHLTRTWWSVARILAGYERPAKVHLVTRVVGSEEIDRLHTRGDCCVSLARSEGWGLVPFDALLFDTPAVVTGWGGQLDYLGEDYPWLVDYTLEPTALSPSDGLFLRSERALWARADRRCAGERMRWIFEHRDEARAIAREVGAGLRSRYSRSLVAGRLARGMGFDVGG